jgi:hypothetical protein
MSQPQDGYYRRQPAGQPPPPSFSPTGYRAAGQRHAQASGSTSPQAPPTPRAPRKRTRKRNAIFFALAGILLVGVIVAGLSGGGKPAKSLTAATSSAAASRASAIANAETACYKRPAASGDIYIRLLTRGGSEKAQRIGGGWTWDHTSNKCLTSVQMVMATAPLSTGNCTQVGYVANNPGYDPNASPAAPLAHVAAHAGPACQEAHAPTQATRPAAPPAPVQTTRAAAPPAPAPTTPAAAPPPPPASTAPAGCNPLSDEGTCYEPGEYCRDSDHGLSGVAGDGEAITCEDNDGWRWEPA